MSNTENLTYDGEWTFQLEVINKSKETFKLTTKNLAWGHWYTDSTDDKEPADIKPGASQVLGIRASSGTWTGYECTCTWRTGDSVFTIWIDVPFSRDNQSKATLDGSYKLSLPQTGWPLPSKGHRFTATFTIIDPDDNEVLDAEATGTPVPDPYQQMLTGTNDMVQDWSKLEAGVSAVTSFNPLAVLPAQYSYPPAQILMARSDAQPIDKKLWEGIGDPVYDTYPLQLDKVSDYFTAAIYSMNTDPRSVQSIPAGETRVTKRSVEVASAIKNTIEKTFSIGTSLSVKAPVGDTGAEIAAKLESTYQHKNVMETSCSKITREEQTSTIEASSQNRLFVPWVFSTAVAIYRKRKKDGRIDLVAISEWADQVIDKVYEY